MKSQRPVNLDLRTIKLPITAYTSILHRVSGVILFVGIALLLLALDTSLSSPEGFEEVRAYLGSPLAKLVSWALLSALLYHLVAGVRHLIMDSGHGETLEGGKLGTWNWSPPAGDFFFDRRWVRMLVLPQQAYHPSR